MQVPTTLSARTEAVKVAGGDLLRHLPRFLLDAGLVGAAYGSALLLRFDGAVPAPYPSHFLRALPVVLALYLLTLVAFGIHEQLWQFAGIPELMRLWGAVTAATGVVMLTDVTFIMDDGIWALPLAVVLMGGLLSAVALTGSRLWPRLLAARPRAPARTDGLGQRALIVGCGSAGQLLARELRHGPGRALAPVGYVDDDPAKLGKFVHGLRVLGTRKDIPRLVAEHAVEVVTFAIPSQPELLREVVRLCRGLAVKVRNVPSLMDIAEGRAPVSALRPPTIEELLRRDEVRLDHSQIAGRFAGKTVLVTGAAGSIGAELCRQLLPFGPARLLCLDTNESGLFDLEHVLRVEQPAVEIRSLILDVTDFESVCAAFEAHRPHVVFHAAAYKHVPLMEAHPLQALRVNLLGTDNVCRAASGRAEEFVLISTDKAVNPRNVMGCSKRLAEQLVADWQGRSETRYCAVRFGNVLGSRGSVVPLFKSQIEAGGPVTVTDPEATRYFMTVREAVQLVIQAAAFNEGGSLLVLDMGEPVRIGALAEDMVTLSGLAVGRDIEIVTTGLRPGEKLHEELFTPAEAALLHTTGHAKIRACRLDPGARADLAAFLDELRAGRLAESSEGIRQRLRELIPEYRTETDEERE